jgi:low temperature requirement protein LtrA
VSGVTTTTPSSPPDRQAPAGRSVRVSTLELFFDLVFVFTITQLTGVLVAGHGVETLIRVVVLLLLIWWMYDAYAWLTNAIATDRLRFRLLLIGGMGGFLVIALAVPDAYRGDGLAFGIAYLVVVLLHASCPSTCSPPGWCSSAARSAAIGSRSFGRSPELSSG